jgi:hypothetical protein
MQDNILQASDILASLPGFFQGSISGNIANICHAATENRLFEFGLIKAIHPALHTDTGS